MEVYGQLYNTATLSLGKTATGKTEQEAEWSPTASQEILQ
jgi:hypothetical protein